MPLREHQCRESVDRTLHHSVMVCDRSRFHRRRLRRALAQMMETQTARCRVDDIAGSVLPMGNVFFVWVTLNEQKWISFAERRGIS